MSTDLGALADAIYAKDEEIKAANAVVKGLQSEKTALEDRLLAAMDEAGTTLVRGQIGKASREDVSRPRILDADKFFPFVLRKKALHLFERRISVLAYKEMKEELGGKEVPGLTEYLQPKLKVSKV